MKNILITVLLSAAFIHINAADRLKASVEQFISRYDAEIGVAVITGNDTVEINCNRTYPLASVVKFPQALAACDMMQKNGTPLDSVITITKADLHENTYSPMRLLHPEGTETTIDSLLYYSIALSDNNACDKIFNLFASPSETQKYLHEAGLNSFTVSATENDMHLQPSSISQNSASPTDAAMLFKLFADKKLISGKYFNSVLNALKECKTGQDQLRKNLPAGSEILHKTGTGFRNGNGRISAQNDAGYIRLPDGTEYAIAVLITNSAESDSVNSSIIAGISEIVSAYLLKN